MRKKSMKILSLLLTLVMLLGLLPGMSLTAYATTFIDVYILMQDLRELSDQKMDEGDVRARRALMEAYDYLASALSDAGGDVTPEVERVYNIALAVYQQYSGGGHTHSWNYQASGASVTATCTGNGDCDYKTNGVTLTISAPANLECDGNAKAAAISGEIPGGSGLPDPSNITYNPGGSSAPTEPGTYTASFTWGGAPASVSFTLTANAYTVTLTGGANATPSGGATTQSVTPGQPMTDVFYFANSGNKFPETSDLYKTTNGITVARTSDTLVTVSGTPTANATITVPDATAIPTYTVTYIADNGTGETFGPNPMTLPYTVERCMFAAPDGMRFVDWLVKGTADHYPENTIIESVSGNLELIAQWEPASQGGGTQPQRRGGGLSGDLVFFGGSGMDNSWEYIGGGVPQRAYRLSFAPMQGGSAYFLLNSGENGETMNVYPQTTVRVVPTPAPGYRLASIVWSMIDGSASYDITESQTFVMPAMDAVVYVTFQPVA